MTNKNKQLPLVKGKWPWKAAFDLIKDPIGRTKKQFESHGDIYRVSAPIPFVVVTGYEHAKTILQQNWRNYTKGPAYKGFGLMLGDGILNSEGEKWKKQRKMIQPSFNKEAVNQLYETMSDQVDELIKSWQRKKTSSIQLKDEMIAISIKIISVVLIGEARSSHYEAKLLPLIQKQYSFVLYHNRNFFKFPLWFPTRRNIVYKKTKEELKQLVHEIIALKKTDNDDTLLCRLIQATDEQGNKMTTDELHDEFLTLFVTGYETTGSALSWALILLAQHKKMQDKLVEELIENDTHLEGVTRSKWLNGVIKETLRLYPSVWLIARKPIVEDHVNGWKIPKKAHVLICSFIAHRDPKYWQDPEKFLPQRFFNRQDLSGYMPFGLGARMCIGNHFSHIEMMAVLAKMSKAYSFSLPSDQRVEIDPKITLQPKGDLSLNIVPR
ncbi:cytochrome P450 [Lishizhenia sp.]|uniref:cytochrome P450 n=1 Tax=Lishizhenia sp. TaxID=2497594 RepID=UPI00299EED1F|nr:cytochrome P450 [Lishizhenia sp.]MDX1446368.1 cytochrome P450 [Lishizhenia sp.]